MAIPPRRLMMPPSLLAVTTGTSTITSLNIEIMNGEKWAPLAKDDLIMVQSQLAKRLWSLVDTPLMDRKFNYKDKSFKNSRSLPTEVWELSNGSYRTISPTLTDSHISFGVILYPVDADFCQ